jgi:hypothetical protein
LVVKIYFHEDFSKNWGSGDPKGLLVYPGILLASLSGLSRHFASAENL